MKKIIIMAAALVLLTGCGSKEKFPEVLQESPSEAATDTLQTTDSEPEKQLEEAELPLQDAEKVAEDSLEANDETTASSEATENVIETPEVSELQTEATDTQGTFDAEQAVSIEVIEGGVQVIFQQLPQTASDMQAMVELYSQADARIVCAFFHAALVRYPESAEDCFAMMDVLRGPQPLSDTDKAFIKERLSDKLYLPRAYFEGAVPKNEYQPEEPWTIIIYDDPVTPPEGYAYTMVKTSGADSSRRIVMRVKDDLNYLWEYNAALLSIRLPASEDPWV